MEGYCLKCKKKISMDRIELIKMNNGKPALTGNCPNCGTKIYKIGSIDWNRLNKEEDAQAIKILGEEYFY